MRGISNGITFKQTDPKTGVITEFGLSGVTAFQYNANTGDFIGTSSVDNLGLVKDIAAQFIPLGR